MIHEQGAITGPKPDLTARQRAAVDSRGVSVALCAGAGCGKTRVLADRWLSLATGPDAARVDQLIALTFTEKAATELRDRVRNSCRERFASAQDATERTLWKRLGWDIEAAMIGTFHSFCGELLREHAIAAGADPGFEIKDQVIVPTLITRAVSMSLRDRIASSDPDLKRLLRDRTVAGIRDLILELIERRRGADFELLAATDPEDVVASWKSYWEERILPEFRERLARLADELSLVLIPEQCTSDKLRARLIDMQSRLPDLTASAPLETWRTAIVEFRALAKLSGARGSMFPNAGGYEALKTALAALNDLIDELLKKHLSSDDASSLAAAEQGQALARLVASSIERLEQDKRESGWFDFDDLLVRVQRLLREDVRVRARLQNRIRFILVDEFQDTDPIQAEILELLGGERIDEGLFLVGDQKQSIYRFRGARPDLFDRFAGLFPEAGRLSLVENFRARASLIDFTNCAFRGGVPWGSRSARARRRPRSPRRHEAHRVRLDARRRDRFNRGLRRQCVAGRRGERLGEARDRSARGGATHSRAARSRNVDSRSRLGSDQECRGGRCRDPVAIA